METRIIPVFATEADEAQWWYDHRDEIAADMVAAVREGRNGIGTLGRARQRQEAAETAARQAQSVTR